LEELGGQRPSPIEATTILTRGDPQPPRIQRINNALTRELAHELPPISITTREKLTDWNDFLKWKRRLVSEKTRGLRFIQREWQDDRIVFKVSGESEQYLRDVHRSLSRQDVMAFDLNVSVDAWTFRIDDRDSAKRAPRGFELGQPEAMTKLGPHADKIKDCEWQTPFFAEVAVGLSEDDQNQMTVAEDVPTTQRMLLSRIPEQGFLSVSAAGDLALIRRHEMAIKRLQDQGGYTMQELDELSLPGARELLAWTDVLVDGPYESANPDRRRNWVGSANQRFHYLTKRYDASIEGADAPNREVEWRVRDDGRFVVNGWPCAIK
jgi:hypothetical protein